MIVNKIFQILVPAVFLLSSSLRADVTIKSTTAMEGIGGLMNSEGSALKMLSGMKAKNETNTKMTGKMAKFMGGGKEQDNAEIIRVDKEVFWNLNVKDKEYTEKTFAEMAAQYKKMMDKVASQKASAEKKGNDSVTVKTEFKVTRTGKKQKIAGYDTEEAILTGTVTGKNNQSGENGSMILTMDMWLTQDAPGQEEYKEFYKAFSAKLGITSTGQEGLGKSLLAMGVDPTELEKEADKLKGFPMMTVVTMTAAGDTTQQSAGKQAKKSDKESGSADKSSSSQSSNNPLSSLFGKKKDKSKDESGDKKSEASGSEEAGPAYILKYTDTVTEITKSAIPASEFEVPGTFKKK